MGIRSTVVWSVVLAALAPSAANAGMGQVLQATGPYALSIDGAGSSVVSNLTWQITKPTPGATVYQVWATVSGTAGLGDPGANCLTVAGFPLALGNVRSDLTMTPQYTRYADVTASLAGYLNALPVGTSNVALVEGGSPGQNDGSGLIVVWEDPLLPISTVALSFGSALTGNNPTLGVTTQPLDTTVPDFRLDVGVGIAFSAGPPQQSSVRLNGSVLVNDAGGYDDGNLANGGLYTLGGDFDGTAGERYNVTNLVNNGDTVIELDFAGNTFDDYAVVMWVFGTGILLEDYCDPSNGDIDGDGVADDCDLCPLGDDNLDADGDGFADACDVCLAGDDLADADLDLVADACDLCPGFDDAVDLDGDLFADGCEPTLDFASPKRGPDRGGETTLLYGAGFDGSCVASFDGVPAATGFLNTGVLSAEPEPGTVGLVDVEVACDLGIVTLGSGYTYYDDAVRGDVPPDLVSVDPRYVNPTGFETVILTGSGFGSDVVVRVDGATVAADRRSDTEIEIVLPPHDEATVDVAVENTDGLSDVLPAALQYVVPPGGPTAPDGSTSTGVGKPRAGGCSTAGSPAGFAPLAALALVAFARRRARIAVAVAAAGCSEYELTQGVEQAGLPSPTAPVALTGAPLSVVRDEPATLDGTASYDRDVEGAALTFDWEVIDGPAGADVVLLGADTPNPTFESEVTGTFRLALVVTDEVGNDSENPAVQAVEVVPWRDLEVTLAWDAAVDLDVHLLAPGGAYYGDDDCFFANPSPDWGTAGNLLDDPQLDLDDDADADGPHVETITLPVPAEGVSSIVVVYWNDRGTPVPATATVTVRGHGEELGTARVSLAAEGDAVQVGAIDWETLRFTADGSATTHAALGGPPYNQ